LSRSFFERPVLQVAPDLLGRIVVHDSPHGTVAVRLTEVEAYAGLGDPGSHAFRGRTRRNSVMFGPGGFVYVYFSYGMHWCMNLVCGPAGDASAVLLRAGEVVAGLELAQARRTTARVPHDLARGPARLTSALGVDKAYDGADATDPGSALRLLPGAGPRPARRRVRRGPRVGVAGEGGVRPWRFWIDGEPSVSVYRPAVARRRNA
jgi:DNA-3-methyladenine glycosylase